jgi:alpha-tubulin suppressor-like RCC1 family protein
MALAADATVWDWGTASHGELGDGRTDLSAEATPVHVPLQGVRQIDGGDGVSMAVLADGTMWTWGRDIRFAPHTAPDILSPTKVSGVRDVAQFAIDAFTVLVLMAPQPVAVPNLQYSDPVSAGYFLNAVGLNVGPNTPPTGRCFFGDGDVQGQNPAAGTVVQAGTSVDYYFDCVVP